MVTVRQISKVSRCGGREYLGHSLFKLGRDFPVVIEKVPASGHRVSSPSRLSPGVFLAGVVQNKVQAQGDIPPTAGIGQCLQIFHGTQVGAHPAKIGYGIASIAFSRRGVQKRHQMEVVDSTFLQVSQLLPHAVQCSGKTRRIEHHTQHLAGPAPVRIGQPFFIPSPKSTLTLGQGGFQHLQKIGIGLFIIPIERGIEPPEFFLAGCQSFFKQSGFLHRAVSFQDSTSLRVGMAGMAPGRVQVRAAA